MKHMKETRGIIIILYYTENATLKGWLCMVSVSSKRPDARRCAVGYAPFNVFISVAFFMKYIV